MDNWNFPLPNQNEGSTTPTNFRQITPIPPLMEESFTFSNGQSVSPRSNSSPFFSEVVRDPFYWRSESASPGSSLQTSRQFGSSVFCRLEGFVERESPSQHKLENIMLRVANHLDKQENTARDKQSEMLQWERSYSKKLQKKFKDVESKLKEANARLEEKKTELKKFVEVAEEVEVLRQEKRELEDMVKKQQSEMFMSTSRFEFSEAKKNELEREAQQAQMDKEKVEQDKSDLEQKLVEMETSYKVLKSKLKREKKKRKRLDTQLTIQQTLKVESPMDEPVVNIKREKMD